jgi:predicted thioredoxin/glutaredoxin
MKEYMEDQLNQVPEETEQEKVLSTKIIRIKTELEKIYKSLLEQFFNFIKYKGLSIETDIEKIKELDIFLDLYLCNIILSIYTALFNGENIDQESIEIIKLVNILEGQKFSIRSILNRFSKMEMQMFKEYPAYKLNVERLMDEFYKITLLNKYDNININ